MKKITCGENECLFYWAVLPLSPILFREKLTGKKLVSVIIVGIGLICISGSVVVIGMNLFLVIRAT